MKYLHQVVLVSVLGVLSVATLGAQESNPFSGQSYRGKTTSGKIDSHFYIGGGISNLGHQYMPLISYDERRKEWGLSSSLDVLFGLGYFVAENVSLGLESGVSVNWNSNKKKEGYYLRDVSQVGGFWDPLTPESFIDAGYDIDRDIASLSLTTVEVPLRFYTKLSVFGDSIKWLALQGFVGFNLAFTKATTDFYMEADPAGSGYYELRGTREDDFFAPAFTVGARASLAFLGIEYSYHLGLDNLYKNFDYYKNREHRISIGFTINSSL